MDKEKYVAIVSKALYDREDKFPNEETHGQTHLKCTNGWLTGVMGCYSIGKLSNFLSFDTCKYHNRVSKKLAKEYDKNRLTQKGDVRAGNRLLRMALIDCGC